MASPKDMSEKLKGEIMSTLEAENLKLKKENEQLRNELVMAKSVTGKFPSTEELICIEQIAILRNRSVQRELSLEEVKKLDLLVKNLRLLQEQSTENVNTNNVRDVSEALLVAVASEPES